MRRALCDSVIAKLLVVALIGLVCETVARADDQSIKSTGSASTPPDPQRQVVNKGPILLTLRVEPSEAMVAEPIFLLLTVEGPDNMELTPPPFGERLGDLDVTSVRQSPGISVEPDSGRRVWMTEVTVESIRTGSVSIPPIEVACRLLGRDEILTTKPTSITIASVLKESETPDQIRDLKETIDAEVSPAGGALIAGLIVSLATLVLVVSAVFVYRRRRALTPIALARSELADLRASSPPPSFSDGYGRLSQILRAYLESKTGISATSQTTEELIESLGDSSQLGDELKSQVTQFVLDADRVRYQGADANNDPPIRQIEELIDQIEKSPVTRGAA